MTIVLMHDDGGVTDSRISLVDMSYQITDIIVKLNL